MTLGAFSHSAGTAPIITLFIPGAPLTGRSLTEKKKLFQYMVFSKMTACSSYVQPWLVAIGGWRLVEIAGWELVIGGSWRLAAVDGWWLVAVGGWRRLAVGGSWRLAVGGPLGRSLRVVLNQKKNLVPEGPP